MIAKNDSLATLVSVPSEFEAQLLVNLLHDRGIAARATGASTANFRAEAPGSVRVLVNSDDLAAARSAVEEARTRDQSSDETEATEPSRSRLVHFGFWAWFLLGWLATALAWSAHEIQPIDLFMLAAFTVLSLAFLWRDQADLRRSKRLGITAILVLELVVFGLLWLTGTHPVSFVVVMAVATFLLAVVWRR